MRVALERSCIKNPWSLQPVANLAQTGSHYSEVIDWSQAVIDWDERLLLELKEHLVDISPDKIFQMRQQGAMLYNLYFSSIDQIIQSTFEIIRERIFPEEKRDSFIWNTNPGKIPSKKYKMKIFA